MPSLKKSKSKPEPEPVEEESEWESESEESDADVNEEGMASLMRALEKHPLDDFERAQLVSLNGDDSEGEEESAEENEDEESAKGSQISSEEEEEELDEEEEAQDDENEEEIELDRLSPSHELDPDAVPKQKVQINNEAALRRIRESFALDSSLPWTETLALNYDKSIDVDPEDDLKRELAFYAQALESTNEARKLASKHQLPFTRPSDFFAEMVKSDAHMERIRVRLLSESATIKKSEEKRKEREGKKFGKQVQLEKQKERERSRKEMEERVKNVKRKRKDILDAADGDDGAFDVAVEDAISERPNKKSRVNEKPTPSARDGKAGGRHSSGKLSRKARDSKFGFGGKTRREKSNNRESTDSFVSGGAKRTGKGAKGKISSQKRPGKSRRMAKGGR